ncbi:hypothetical protein OGAPHI_001751 [Ogataea philodendri]|uniref:CBS domain-containing protein n=1 Tax=Ogataea philodendri TaxID=1378263 RepID=A0A9P8P9Q9_9ASCO|nr:uncharacterized protein OGAPHI_001751 [Ogataea philodendri]KAH3667997.1 hypothetical protein OGAPHI_001751 [Ogataea philodendri]
MSKKGTSSARASVSAITRIADVPIQCLSSCSVLEAARLMNEGRNHCIIVNDPTTGKLCGLVTAKDLAFRVVAEHAASSTLVREIMTPNPFIMSFRASANEALRLMVTNKIRHLPLVDQTGSVVGVLNITKCFYHAMIRLEKMASEAKKLETTFNELREASLELDSNASEFSKYSFIQRTEAEADPQEPSDAFTSNENLMDLGIIRRKQKIVKELKTLIEAMTQPNLKTVIHDRDLDISAPLMIDTKSSVLDAVRLLKEHNVTAVLVCESKTGSAHCDHVIGILTSKDVAFRVLASNSDPKTISVARVMTPKPNFAEETLQIHTALRLMFEGKFLNLPIKDSSGYVTGIVSVLQLTYILLKTLDVSTESSQNLLETDNNSMNSFEDGPAWNRFWGSLDQPLSTIESTEKSSRRSSYHIPRKAALSNSSTNDTPPPSVPYIGPVRNISYDRAGAVVNSFSAASSETAVNNVAVSPEMSNTIEPSFKLKIKEKLGLGLNNKIYKIRVPHSEEKSATELFHGVKYKIYQKVDIDRSVYRLELSYIDEDGDLISVERDEDFENVMESKHAYLVLEVKERYADHGPDLVSWALCAGCLVMGVYIVRKLCFARPSI